MKTSLLQIKKQINTFEIIRKMTKTVEAIANMKQKKTNEKYINSLNYFNEIKRIIETSGIDFSYYKTDPTLPRLYVDVTSDMGMCGNFNIKNENIMIKKIKKDDYIIAIGKKGNTFLNNNGYENNILLSYNENISLYDIKYIAKVIIAMYLNKKISNVVFVYCSSVKKNVFEIVEKEVFPFENKKTLNLIEEKNNLFYLSLLQQYLIGFINFMLCDSKYSEINYRINAMHYASEKTNEEKELLKSIYNKKRQEKITNETNLLSSFNNYDK